MVNFESADMAPRGPNLKTPESTGTVSWSPLELFLTRPNAASTRFRTALDMTKAVLWRLINPEIYVISFHMECGMYERSRKGTFKDNKCPPAMSKASNLLESIRVC